jgi:hypothetical protein
MGMKSCLYDSSPELRDNQVVKSRTHQAVREITHNLFPLLAFCVKTSHPNTFSVYYGAQNELPLFIRRQCTLPNSPQLRTHGSQQTLLYVKFWVGGEHILIFCMELERSVAFI